MNIYVLCGLPGSGKSTWAKRKSLETGAIIINRDSLRTMFYGEYKFDQYYEYIIKNCAEVLVRELLDCGSKDIIIDECNISSMTRFFWLNIVNCNYLACERGSVKVILVWFRETERNVEFREKDDLRGLSKEYWSNVISTMREIFVIPSEKENFDELIEVTID